MICHPFPGGRFSKYCMYMWWFCITAVPSHDHVTNSDNLFPMSDGNHANGAANWAGPYVDSKVRLPTNAVFSVCEIDAEARVYLRTDSFAHTTDMGCKCSW